jgi:nucleoside-diphosphate-sugar epimerase
MRSELGALEGADAMIHLANIPGPGLCTPALTFNANVAMNFNVFHAAARLRLRLWRQFVHSLPITCGAVLALVERLYSVG